MDFIGDEAGRWLLAGVGFFMVALVLVSERRKPRRKTLRRVRPLPPLPLPTKSREQKEREARITALRARVGTGTPSTSVAILRMQRERFIRAVQGELVAMIDEAKVVARGSGLPMPTGERDYAATTTWVRKAEPFLETVFGSLERQRFQSEQGSEGEGYMERRIRALEDLRDRPDSWHLRVDAEGLAEAVATRRHYDTAERIMMAKTDLLKGDADRDES